MFFFELFVLPLWSNCRLFFWWSMWRSSRVDEDSQCNGRKVLRFWYCVVDSSYERWSGFGICCCDSSEWDLAVRSWSARQLCKRVQDWKAVMCWWFGCDGSWGSRWYWETIAGPEPLLPIYQKRFSNVACRLNFLELSVLKHLKCSWTTLGFRLLVW